MCHNNLAEQKCLIFNSLFEKNNLQDIVNFAESILKNPIFILDTSYHIITRSLNAQNINSSIEVYNGTYYLIESLINLMKKNKCIDYLYEKKNAFFFKDERSKDDFIFCPIKINNLTAFYICILNDNNNFTDEHLELTNTLSKVLTVQFERDDHFISNSGSEIEYYLVDLILNKIENADYINKRLTSLNFKLQNYFLILVIPFKHNSGISNHNFALKELFKNIKNIIGSCIYTYYKENLIFLSTSNNNVVISPNSYNRLNQFLKLNKLSCGVSIPFTNILHSSIFFNQALEAAKTKRKSNILFFEDLIDVYLINKYCESNAPISLKSLIHPSINKLIAYDSKHNTELLKTLEAYLLTNRNVNSASAKLNIHKNTFFYRFHRIEEIIECSLEKNNMLFKLELSLKLLDYIKKNEESNLI